MCQTKQIFVNYYDIQVDYCINNWSFIFKLKTPKIQEYNAPNK